MIEERISYSFNNKDLLRQALSHPSSKKSKNFKDYERMEFLGDSILGFVIAEKLYKKFPKEAEGSLAKRKSAIVCRDSLAEIAIDIGLDKAIILGHGEDKDGGRENKSNLENALEALIAAIYLDSGIEEAEKFITAFFTGYIDKMKSPPKDPKSRLQEFLQGSGREIPEYNIISMEGPSHEPLIEVEVVVEDKKVTIKDSSRKAAERKAAKKMLEVLDA